jgi:hypothetical protein
MHEHLVDIRYIFIYLFIYLFSKEDSDTENSIHIWNFLK